MPYPGAAAHYAKRQGAQANTGEAARPAAEHHEAGERKAQLRAITSGLLYWKGSLNVLRMAQLPKWRGCFQWQIEAQIEALQAADAWLRTEGAEGGG